MSLEHELLRKAIDAIKKKQAINPLNGQSYSIDETLPVVQGKVEESEYEKFIRETKASKD